MKGSCRFYPRKLNAAADAGNSGALTNAEINAYDPVEDGAKVVARVAESVGLQANFEVLQASDVPNAAAVIYEQKRYVLYNKDFIKQIDKQAATEWAAWTIMAHEVGHHLNGHTLTDVGSRPPLELEADHFAGFAVRRMGGTLQQTISAYELLGEEGSTTHPPRKDRIESVTSGWNQAGLIAREVPTTPVTAATAAKMLQTIIEQLQAAKVPNVALSPLMIKTIRQEAQFTVPSVQQRGYVIGIQLVSQQPLPNGAYLYRFQVQMAKGSMVWRLWLDQAGTLTGLQYS